MKQTPTAAELIKKYIECRDSITIIQDRADKEIRPYKDGMELIENLLLEEINRLGGKNIGTQYGIAYRTITTSVRVADREAWLNWVFENNQRDMLTAHVAKEAVLEYQEKSGERLPGLNMTLIAKCSIRRSDNE